MYVDTEKTFGDYIRNGGEPNKRALSQIEHYVNPSLPNPDEKNRAF